MTKYPFYAALSQLREFYGIELDEDTFETYAMSAWNKIGNKDFRPKVICVSPLKDENGGWYVCKPCDMDCIEAITLNHEDAQVTSSVMNYPGVVTHPVEDWIELNKHDKDSLYISGKFVKYKELGDRIYFNEPFKSVNILYKALYADEDGLPFLNDKEVDAIAAYCAYAYDLKQARLTKNQADLAMAQLEEQKWQKLCSAARIPMNISQNQMNHIMDAAVSRDVHNYGRTNKPIR